MDNIIDISQNITILKNMTNQNIHNKIIQEQLFLQFLIGNEKKNINEENYIKFTTITQNAVEFMKELNNRKKQNFEISSISSVYSEDSISSLITNPALVAVIKEFTTTEGGTLLTLIKTSSNKPILTPEN